MIKKVILKNWKSHLETELEFSKGTNALIGIMGSGKSSIMQAVCFALFGTFPALSSKKMELGDLIMKKPIEKKSASVEIEFEIGGKKYYVKRVIEAGRTVEAEIRENDKLLEVNPKGVTRQVERILQIDYDLFSKAIYSEQDGLDYFLRIPKGKRMQHIDEMLRVDRYEKVRANAVSLKNRILERCSERLKTIEEMKSKNIPEKIKEIEAEINEKKGRKSEIEFEMKILNDKWASVSRKIKEYEDKEKLLHDKEKELEGIKASMSEMKENLESINKKLAGISVDENVLESIEADIKYFEDKIDVLDDEIKKLSKRMNTVSGEMIFIENKIQEFEDQKKEIKNYEKNVIELQSELGPNPEEKVKSMKTELEEKRKKFYSIEALKNEKERELEELKKAGNVCPVCDSKITEKKKEKLIKEKEERLEKIEDNVVNLRGFILTRTIDIENFEKKMDELKKIKELITNFEKKKKEIEECRKNYESLNEELMTLSDKKAKCESEMEKLRKDLEAKNIEKERFKNFIEMKKQAESIEKKLEMYSKKENVIVAEIARICEELKEADIESLKKKFEDIIGKKKGMETELKSIDDLISEKNVRLSELKNEEEILNKYLEETGSYKKIADMLDDFTEAIKLTQEQLRSEFLININNIMAHIWPDLYPYGDFSEVRLVIDNDYVLQLKGSRSWVSADLVSGGERSLACLALRVAFSLAFAPNIKWLILDEPTHNLDANAIRKLGETLKERLDQFIDQVFIITHEESLSDSITGKLYKLERDKEKDGVTRVVSEVR